MAFPALCSPRSARLLLFGSTALSKLSPKLVHNQPRPPAEQAMKRVSRKRRRAPRAKSKAHPADRQVSIGEMKTDGDSRPAVPLPIPILKPPGATSKVHQRHVSFGDVIVHELEEFSEPVFPPPRFAVFPAQRVPFPPCCLAPLSPPVVEFQHLPRRKRSIECTSRSLSSGSIIGIVACSIAFSVLLTWLDMG
ncbi:uncharacterized protein N7482_009267 [Penicillium canariense]|uniref:Uncharacterized protein n=1 Tax=Penicillium canariense TaxID=189055 RepID=A0A9W9HSS2_9EURO|nr:uncharacterized protein N7482_009267 [Penicillium canariense]KAJ5152789.1 hypothetical protein N7482_009267 [Penicillium canariense]